MNEHLTALFVAAMYHWFTGNEPEANKDMFIVTSILSLRGRVKVLVA